MNIKLILGLFTSFTIPGISFSRGRGWVASAYCMSYILDIDLDIHSRHSLHSSEGNFRAILLFPINSSDLGTRGNRLAYRCTMNQILHIRNKQHSFTRLYTRVGKNHYNVRPAMKYTQVAE